MIVGIPREVYPGERRVAATPSTVKRLAGMGFEVVVEAGAGVAASFPDDAFTEAGARIEADGRAVWAAADVLLKVRAPAQREDLGAHEADLLREGATLIAFLWPDQNEELVKRLAERGVSAVAVDKVPRISRAQTMDALSSMANIAGYRAVIEAAAHFGSFFTGQITAAGRVPPATVLVIGAGVAGLQALATAKAQGAIVRAFDTREAVRDQVKSLGGEFLSVEVEESGEGKGGYAKVMSQAFIDAEMALFREQARQVDIVISTALIPGRPAPKLWLEDMVQTMKPGSVVVDLASEQGGNCELTVPGEVVERHGVTIIGYTDLTSRLPTTSSQLYGTNLVNLVTEMGGGEAFTIDLDNEIVRSALVAHGGEVMWPPPKTPEPTAAEPAKQTPPPAEEPSAPERAVADTIGSGRPARRFGRWIGAALALAAVAGWIALRANAAEAGEAGEAQRFLQHLTVFVLACFVGWQLIWAVKPALHTPLMSVTNAISGIIVVGGLLHASYGDEVPMAALVLGLAALFFATINISGGFLVTQRMLRMFRKG